MSKRGGGDRNKERLRNQADTEPYDTQDVRPDYEGSRVDEEAAEEREDIARAHDKARERSRNKPLDIRRG